MTSTILTDFIPIEPPYTPPTTEHIETLFIPL